MTGIRTKPDRPFGGAAAAVVVAGSLSLMMPKSSGASELPGLSGLTPAKAAYLQLYFPLW